MIWINTGTIKKTIPYFLSLCWLLASPNLNAQTENSLFSTDSVPQPDAYVLEDTLTMATNLSPELIIDEVVVLPEKCNHQNGSIQVMSSGGRGTLRYSLDGTSFQLSNIFPGLKPGWYTIYVMDAEESTTMAFASVESKKGFALSVVSTTPAECEDQNGLIDLSVTGGIEPYFYSLNNGSATLESRYTNLSQGNYSLHIEDAQGCSIDTTVIIKHLPCPLYIPNVFSPNGDGVNDVFQVRVNDEQNINITRFFIFDRFGKKVYERFDLPALSNVGWWDGTFKHFTVSAGVYYYFLEVEYENGTKETFKGDLTLLR